MEQPSQPSIPNVRYRINTATTTKGIVTWDATVELTEPLPLDGDHAEEAKGWQDLALLLSDRLVAELKAKYPIEKAAP